MYTGAVVCGVRAKSSQCASCQNDRFAGKRVIEEVAQWQAYCILLPILAKNRAVIASLDNVPEYAVPGHVLVIEAFEIALYY